MSQISILIKPASSLCNLRCKYCFYADVAANRELPSMGVMSEETMHNLIDKSLAAKVDQVNYCFQGGEPTMAGIDYFKKFIAYAEEHKGNKAVTYAIQSNGTRIDEEWVKMFKTYKFLVGISVDGFKENHDRVRPDANQCGTHERILKTVDLLKKYEVDFNILTVLTHELSMKPDRLFNFYKKNHLDYIQLIPCLPSLEGGVSQDSYALTPHDFARFYKKFYDLWFAELQRGHYMSVTLFDNVIPMYNNIPPQQCGMLGRCAMQFVVEGNGNVYPCDFYVLDKYLCGNINEDSFDDLLRSSIGKNFIAEQRRECKKCKECRFLGMCHGNCKRLGVCYYNEDYCGYQEFLEYTHERNAYIAKNMRFR